MAYTLPIVPGSPLVWPNKATGDEEDYQPDITAWLGKATLAKAAVGVIPPGALSVVSIVIDPAGPIGRLTGGTPGASYSTVWAVDATDGRQKEFSIAITIDSTVDILSSEPQPTGSAFLEVTSSQLGGLILILPDGTFLVIG